jgi:hypothetical protein
MWAELPGYLQVSFFGRKRGDFGKKTIKAVLWPAIRSVWR